MDVSQHANGNGSPHVATSTATERRARVRALVLAAAKARATDALTLAPLPNATTVVSKGGDARRMATPLFAPFSPTPNSVVHDVWAYLRHEELAPAPHELLVDLGCGDGRWIISGVQQFGCRALGIELDPELVLATRAQVNALGLGGRVDVIEADIWTVPLQGARVVIVYAFAEALPGIREYLQSQLSEDAIVLSIGFQVPEWRPSFASRVGGLRWYLYEMRRVLHS